MSEIINMCSLVMKVVALIVNYLSFKFTGNILEMR